jgi:hypothetical protein
MLFGTKIDASVLSALPQYADKNITPKDLGEYAAGTMADHQKDADDNVNGMKQEYGNGISTLVMIYNASGYQLQRMDEVDTHGHVGDWPLDTYIENGQWSVFLHVHSSGAAVGSEGYCDYSLVGTADTVRFSWASPYTGSNTAEATMNPANPNYDASESMAQGSSGKVTFIIKNI